METQSLYNLSPLWSVMLTGTLVTFLPLGWLWWRKPQTRRLQALTMVTLFLIFDLVLFGAFTRLTDSGLGCPDWPGCYGHSSPLGAVTQISAAQTVMPSGPVSHGKAWIEMLHRYLATGAGVLILVLTVAHWRGRRQLASHSSLSPWWATATLVWVCVQGAFGALTVTMKLFPAIVTLHLLGGSVLLALLTVQAVRLTQQLQRRPAALLSRVARGLIWLVLALVILQVALGGWVSTNYAVLACTQFPQCQGSWWPVMDFAQGFDLWRELGMSSDGKFLGFEALTAIHYTHRLFAYVVLLAVAGLTSKLWRISALRLPLRYLVALVLVQTVTGLITVLLDWPLLAAILHSGAAAALVAVLVWLLCASRSGAQDGCP